MTEIFTFVKENSLVDKVLVEKLIERFDQIYIEDKHEKLSSSVYVLYRKKGIELEPLYLSLIEKIQNKFESIVGTSDFEFEKLWLVSTKSNDSKKDKLPYIPHIDYRRVFKAMVYLHDVSYDHGPIHLGKVKSNIDLEKKRKSLPKDYLIKGLNTINNNLLKEDLIPMEGKAGDVIFFDTNTPHKAGIIKEGYNRKVLRFDFGRKIIRQKQNFFSKSLNKIKDIFYKI